MRKMELQSFLGYAGKTGQPIENTFDILSDDTV